MDIKKVAKKIRRGVKHAVFGARAADHRRWLLDILPKGGVGAEIGVWKGDFSEKLLADTQPRKLYLIDPWVFRGEMPTRLYGGASAQSQLDMDAIHDDVATRVGSAVGVQILRAGSVEAAAEIPDGELDWVYIDGDHSFEAVLEDLRVYWEKVKVGGLVTGDDYEWRPEEAYPVKRAVQAFLEETGAELVDVQEGQFVIRR